ncbi:MAG: hypothetical protein AB7Y46_01680 [Armatimonadota bacterium]
MAIGCGEVPGLARYEWEQTLIGEATDRLEEWLAAGDYDDELWQAVQDRAAVEDVLAAVYSLARGPRPPDEDAATARKRDAEAAAVVREVILATSVGQEAWREIQEREISNYIEGYR